MVNTQPFNMSCDHNYYGIHSTLQHVMWPYYGKHSTLQHVMWPYYGKHSTLQHVMWPYYGKHSTLQHVMWPYYGKHSTLQHVMWPYYGKHSTLQHVMWPVNTQPFNMSCDHIMVNTQPFNMQIACSPLCWCIHVIHEHSELITRCAYAQGRVKRLSPSIYIYMCVCVCSVWQFHIFYIAMTGSPCCHRVQCFFLTKAWHPRDHVCTAGLEPLQSNHWSKILTYILPLAL